MTRAAREIAVSWLFFFALAGAPSFAITAVWTGEWRWLIGTAVCCFFVYWVMGVRR